MNNESLFKEARNLNFPIGKYALFGSTPMGIRGLKECGDIDIIVTEGIWKKCKNSKEWKFEINKLGVETLHKDDMELLKDWGPGDWDIKELIEDAEIIEGLPFVKLETVLKWKKINGREKDLVDIKKIEDYLK